MTQAVLETKKWGNSIGIILPKEVLEGEDIKGEHEEVFVIIKKKSKTAGHAFGALKGFKWKKTTQQLKDEMRKELYD